MWNAWIRKVDDVERLFIERVTTPTARRHCQRNNMESPASFSVYTMPFLFCSSIITTTTIIQYVFFPRTYFFFLFVHKWDLSFFPLYYVLDNCKYVLHAISSRVNSRITSETKATRSMVSLSPPFSLLLSLFLLLSLYLSPVLSFAWCWREKIAFPN